MSEQYTYFQCPKCGSTSCRGSGQGVLRHFARIIFLRKLVCRRCSYRFWEFSLRRPHPPAPKVKRGREAGESETAGPPR